MKKYAIALVPLVILGLMLLISAIASLISQNSDVSVFVGLAIISAIMAGLIAIINRINKKETK